MAKEKKIITIGMAPSWDVTCYGRNIQWGSHQVIDSQTIFPAGKAMNVSVALAWMGCRNIAAGLWGRTDYDEMIKSLSIYRDLIDIHITPAKGSTRHNIAVVDTEKNTEMHLRSTKSLADEESLQNMIKDISAIADSNSICVFSGAILKDIHLESVLDLIKQVRKNGSLITLDMYGSALKTILQNEKVKIFKPNLEELSQLLGRDVENDEKSIVSAAATLIEKAEIIVVSRGPLGAIAVTEDSAFSCIADTHGKKAASTVGCGDYMLAGLLMEYSKGRSLTQMLESSVKTATARAWGWSNYKPWLQVQSDIRVSIEQI